MKPRSYSKEISGEKKEILSKVIEIRENHTKTRELFQWYAEICIFKTRARKFFKVQEFVES